MKKTATQVGSGQQAKSDLNLPAPSQAVLDLDSAVSGHGVTAEAPVQSQNTAQESSVSVADGGDETAQEPLALSLKQVRDNEAWGDKSWKDQLPRLESLALPLLAVGAESPQSPGDRKAPADLRTGLLLPGGPTAKHSVEQIKNACSKVIVTGTRSSKANPCPVCGRNTDRDCETRSDGLVFCHRGATFAPPPEARLKSDVVPGADGQQWVFLGDSKLGKAMFKPDEPRAKGQPHLRVAPSPSRRLLARLPDGATVPNLDREKATYSYGPKQETRRAPDGKGGKVIKPWHLNGQQWACGAGPDPWPLYQEKLALGADSWVLEFEGERCAGIAMAAGLVAISQPGHNHTPEAITARYAALVAAGKKVFYVADDDDEGRKKAAKLSDCAAAAGLEFVSVNAAKVWPGIPEKGSIDDAPGTAADQVAALEGALLRARAQAPAAKDQEQQQPTPDAKGRPDLEQIRAAADYVVTENINRSRPQYLHRLRELVEAGLTLPARDDLYRREIGEAIIRRDGIESLPFVGGCELPDDDDEYLIQGLILARALNIVGADPKAGKTLWSVALIASLLHGCGEFIGRSITSRPQTIIIVGPDQAVKLWKRQLRAVGLVQGNTLDLRIVRLWDSHNPWAATPEGIAELRQVCAEHPGSLVLVDSFAKVSEKLGIDENSREAAEVLTDIERACIVHGCTPLVIHHNAKAAGRIGIVNGAALRGNGAIRANASQLLILTLIDPDNPKDPRRRLVTEGRGTEFIDSVIQLEDDGRSWRHVCEFSEHRQSAKAEKAREKLTERQAQALRALKGIDEPLTTALVWASAYPNEPWDKDINECKQLSRTLGQLVDKRLAIRHPGTANRPTWSAA